jgi:5'-phosphate synthase pdxT subunit
MSSFSSSSAAPVIGIFAIQGAVEEHANCVKRCGGEVKEIRMPKDFDGLDGIILPGGESTTMAIVGERWGLFPKLRDWVGANKPIWGTCAGMILLSDHAIKQAEGGQSLVGGLDVHVCRNFFGSQMQSCEVDVSLAQSAAGAGQRMSLGGGSADGTGKCPAVFIRAPAILSAGPGVEVLASVVARPHVSAKADVMRVIEEATVAGAAGSAKRRISTHRPATDGKPTTAHIGPSGQFGQSDEEVEVFVAVQKDNILATAFHPELTEDLRWHQYFLEIVQRHKDNV